MLRRGLKLRKEATELDEPAGAPVDHQEPTRKRLVCAACAHDVTAPSERVAIAGRHHHTCVNPAGVVFRIGCFRSATGAIGRGPQVSEHSWFPGYTWQIGICGGCGAHLGWAFRGAQREPFWGLILATLEERDD